MRQLPAALLGLGLVAGCSASSSGTAVQPAQTTVAPAPTVSSCPAVARPRFPWPKPVPADLPQPPAATYAGVSTTPGGITIVRFRTATSLRESVLYVLKAVQAGGYTLGRGDAEPAEADAPFGRDDLRGLYKMVVTSPCVTDWFVAVTRTPTTGAGPLLPRRTTASPSPLPFG